MERITKTWLILGLVGISLFTSCSKIDLPAHDTDKLSNNVIIQWNLVALQAEGGVTYANPLLASRVNAMMHIAMHDALNTITPMYRQYAYKTERIVLADPFAAAANAAYIVLLGAYPEYKSMLDSALSASLSTVQTGVLRQQGLALGMEAANAILRLRVDDDIARNPAQLIDVSTIAGIYNVVPPFDFLFAPHWQTMQPFSLLRPDQFRSIPPPALTSDKYAMHFNEVKKVGSINSTTRTKDQTDYAHWWYEFVEIGWNRVARIKATEHKVGLFATARMFALMNMAVADAYIAGWDSKNFYNFWRPYTAIRAAALDGNNATQPDPNWLPALPTPPVQDYPSTHSTGANAAATVLTHIFGKSTGFTMTSSTGVPPTSTRTFSSFLQAADENADSRVMAGIHFRFATQAGQIQGNEIGKWTVKNYLQPRR
jgi:hypothetical protein